MAGALSGMGVPLMALSRVHWMRRFWMRQITLTTLSSMTQPMPPMPIESKGLLSTRVLLRLRKDQVAAPPFLGS